MPRLLLFFLIIAVPSLLKGQELSGTWVMAHIKAKQPVYVMVEKNGELELDESEVADSTITYNAGLMSLQIVNPDSAVSYSWDGTEIWNIERKDDLVRFNGVKDTLFGQFNNFGALILESTIDEIPIEYVFESVQFKKGNLSLDIVNTTWKINAKNSYLNGQRIIFHPDSALTSIYLDQPEPGEYFIHPLKEHWALEFAINTPSSYMGIIYLTNIRKKKINGVFFSNNDDKVRPKRFEIQFKKVN